MVLGIIGQVLSDIWAGLRFVIDQFLSKAPRPLQIFLFLMFLLAIVSVIPFFTHIIGIHCNSGKEAVKISPLSLATNIKLAFVDSDDFINITSYEPDITAGVTKCSQFICKNGLFYYTADRSECNNQTLFYAFSHSKFEWTQCSICNGEKIYIDRIVGDISESAGSGSGIYCVNGSATPIGNEDKGRFQKLFCGANFACTPPTNYIWNYTTGNYDCNNLDVCGSVNQTILAPEVDELLKETNFELMYNNTNMDYTKAVEIKCDNDLTPNITFFGIPVFDYRIWLFIMVLALMVGLTFKLRR